jgi:predicted transcriptional regulator
MACLPADAEVRHKFRQFTLSRTVDGRVRSVKAFAQALGFDVVVARLPRGMNGRLVRDTFASTGYRIEVSSRISVKAQRFAVLHEIGHYFRHEDHDDLLGQVRHFDPSGSQVFYADEVEERQANEFAEALLFGDGQLAAAALRLSGDVDKLSGYFGVTPRVVAVALAKLRK